MSDPCKAKYEFMYGDGKEEGLVDCEDVIRILTFSINRSGGHAKLGSKKIQYNFDQYGRKDTLTITFGTQAALRHSKFSATFISEMKNAGYNIKKVV